MSVSSATGGASNTTSKRGARHFQTPKVSATKSNNNGHARFMDGSLAGYNDIAMKINRLVLKSFVLLGVPVMGAAIVFPMFAHARENARRASCQSNLKQIGLGLLQYEQDYNGHLPPVKGVTFVPPKTVMDMPTGVYGWADALYPYTKSTCLLNCPSDFFAAGNSSGVRPDKSGYLDYYMNARLSGAKTSNPLAANTVLAGDGIGDERATARYALSFPPDEKTVCGGYNNSCESAWHHLGGANFLFLDGHVKTLQPGEVSATKGDVATFAP